MRKLLLELLQAGEQAVVFHVGNRRSIEGVIKIIVMGDLRPQECEFL